MPPRSSAPRRLPASAALLGAALAAGLLALVTASGLWLLPAAALLGLALLLAPPWWYLGATVLGAVLTALTRVQLPGTIGLLGQGRTAALLGGIALAHVVIRRADFRIPKPAIVVTALYLTSVLLAALVALASGGEAGATLADVQRELSQTIAPLLVALIALSSEAARTRAYRAFGLAALGAATLSVVYWAWDTELLTSLPGWLDALFDEARFSVRERGGPPDRVVFPFVDTDPNSCATILAIFAALGVAPLMATRRLADRVLAALLLVAVIGGVLATQSRMGIVLLLAVGAGYATFSPLSAGKRVAVGGAALVGGVAVLAIVLSVFPEERRLTTEDDNVHSRLAVYQEALADVVASPLYGYGLRYGAQERYYTGLSTHNEYIERLVDGGLVGGLVFLGVLVTFLTMARRTRSARPFEAAVRTGTLTALVVLFISMTAVASWTAVPFLQVISWLTFGIISATYRPETAPLNPPRPPRAAAR